MVLLPDTQMYTYEHPEVFMRQTEWISANHAEHDMRFVLHEGDIVHHAAVEQQWEVAQRGMRVLNRAGVPYSLTTGNHDLFQDPSGKPNAVPGQALDADGKINHGHDRPWIYLRATPLNDFFNPSDYGASASLGLFEPGRLENSWHRFETPTGPVLVLSLEFSPRDAVLEWAGQIAAARPDHLAVLVTHAYTYHDHTRYHWEKYGAGQKWSPRSPDCALLEADGGANDGEDIWNKLIAKAPNIRFVFSGHVLGSGVAYLQTPNDRGLSVHQLLANFQGGVQPGYGWGGGGYLRLAQFLPGGESVRFRSYSPWYDHFLTDAVHDFTLRLR